MMTTNLHHLRVFNKGGLTTWIAKNLLQVVYCTYLYVSTTKIVE